MYKEKVRTVRERGKDLRVPDGPDVMNDRDCCFLIRDSCSMAKSLSPHLDTDIQVGVPVNIYITYIEVGVYIKIYISVSQTYCAN